MFSGINELEFVKTKEVKSPLRASQYDAGIDLFIPVINEEFIEEFNDKNKVETTPFNQTSRIRNNKIVIPAHQRVLIPSGIHFKTPENTALIAFNKSGVATKQGLTAMACVVDSSYTGETHISLLNTTDNNIIIEENKKIIQFLLVPIVHCGLKEVYSTEDMYSTHTPSIESQRGCGGFGSTGN